jgi:hypothetical protein
VLALAAAEPGQGRDRLPAAVTASFATTGTSPVWDQVYTVTPGYQFGIYQKLSTRNQGEIISSDSY